MTPHLVTLQPDRGVLSVTDSRLMHVQALHSLQARGTHVLVCLTLWGGTQFSPVQNPVFLNPKPSS